MSINSIVKIGKNYEHIILLKKFPHYNAEGIFQKFPRICIKIIFPNISKLMVTNQKRPISSSRMRINNFASTHSQIFTESRETV